MKSENSKRNSKEYLKRIVKALNLISKNIIIANDNKLNSKATKQDNTEIETEEIGPHQNKEDVLHWSQKGQFWINLILAIVTGLLFWQTTIQTSNATQAIVRADTANAIATRSLEFANQSTKDNLEFQRRSAQSSDSNTQEALKIANANAFAALQSAKALEQSVRQQGVQFKIENEPYLQMDNFQFYMFTTPGHCAMTYYINNMGKQPVKILTSKMGFAFMTQHQVDTTNTESYFNVKFNISKKNAYITNSTPKRGGDIISWISLIDKDSTFLVDNKYKAVQFGTFDYINLVTKKTKQYKFIISVELPPNDGTTYIFNENNTIK